jgi:hypothetical protein
MTRPIRTTDDAPPDDVVSLLQKKAAFMQHSLPGLYPGKYQITVQQELSHPPGFTAEPDKTLPGKFSPVTKYFGVDAPRYQLEQTAINSVFPPLNSAGEFSHDLVHIVLDHEKLPWLRSPFTPKNVPEVHKHHYTDAGGNHAYDDDVASWLLVLLLGTNDLAGTDPKRLLHQGTVQDLVPDNKQVAAPGGSTVAGTLDHTKGYSIFSYTLEGEYAAETAPIDPGIGVKPTDPCTYIDVPVSLFNSLAPSLADLSMLAHVRQVVMTDKPLQPHQSVTPQKSYALVMSNRLPESFPKPANGTPLTTQPQGQNVAFLISLEHMEFALKGHAGTSYYDATIANNTQGFVRLIVFTSWGFTSWFDTSFQFENLLKGLNGRHPADPNTTPLPNPLLRLPNPPPVDSKAEAMQQVMQTLLGLGYVPMNHVTRVPTSQGEAIQTISWYRGPLIPFRKDATDLPPFIDSTQGTDRPTVYAADKLLRFDPHLGMYDVSYAVAWQLGRLLALNDKSFSVPLYQWRKHLEEFYRRLLEGQVLQAVHSNLLSLYTAVKPFCMLRTASNGNNPEAAGEQLYLNVLQHLKKITTKG